MMTQWQMGRDQEECENIPCNIREQILTRMWDYVPVGHQDLQLPANAGFRPQEGLLLNLEEQRLVVDNHISKGLKSEPDPLLQGSW